MTYLQSLLLGVLQGITEFLPVSSSGHLVAAQNLFGFEEPMLAFDVLLHWATTLAILIYFREDLLKMIGDSLVFLRLFVSGKRPQFSDHPHALVSVMVIVATIPTVIIGFCFQDLFEGFFRNLLCVGIAWIIMGTILILSRKFQSGARPLTAMNHRDAFILGIAQGIAIIPGISRSGSTILAALAAGFDKKDAARFSFLMGIPVIFAAGILKMKDGLDMIETNSLMMLTGFVSAFVSGYFCIAVLLRLIQKGRFHYFGYYCVTIGTLSVISRFFLL